MCWPLPGHTLAAAGDLDPTFGKDGKVTTSFGDAGQANALVIQPDGKIVAGGATASNFVQSFGLARYNTDGSLDTTFGDGGKVTTGFPNDVSICHALALQPDGKIIAAGEALGDGSGSFARAFALARYNINGSLDTTFGNNGRVTTSFPIDGLSTDDRAFTVALQSDGKIVAGGLKSYNVDIDASDFELARYNTDGSLDTTFGDGGSVLTHFFGAQNQVRGLIIQSDGKIVAIGSDSLSENQTFTSDFALARYNTDGSLDSTFGDGGLVITDFPGIDFAFAGALQPDGKIVAAGASVDDKDVIRFALARYNTDGSLDAGFGDDGKVLTLFKGLIDTVFAVALQQNGKIVAAGRASGSPPTSTDFALARYNTDGSLDAGFGDGGKVLTDFFGSVDVANAVAIQPNGKIVAAGFTFRGQIAAEFALARYDDTDFDICIRNDGGGALFRFNSNSGDYLFTDCTSLTLTGTGSVVRRGNLITLQHNAPDRRVLVKVDIGANKATASIQILSQGRTITIIDRDLGNNVCDCR